MLSDQHVQMEPSGRIKKNSQVQSKLNTFYEVHETWSSSPKHVKSS